MGSCHARVLVQDLRRHEEYEHLAVASEQNPSVPALERLNPLVLVRASYAGEGDGRDEAHEQSMAQGPRQRHMGELRGPSAWQEGLRLARLQG